MGNEYNWTQHGLATGLLVLTVHFNRSKSVRE